MSKPILIIPSYARPDGTAIERCKSLPLKKYLFIREEELDLYSIHQPEYTLITQSNGTDIGKVRQNIVNWCDKHHIEWAFMFDDDISKVEFLAERNGIVNSNRILYEPDQHPRIELEALKYWYKIALSHKYALSTVLYRFNRGDRGKLIENGCQCIQCLLLHIPDLISVGGYKSTNIVGAEDIYMQYKLMLAGYTTAGIGIIEYDCPSVGQGHGGNNAVEDSNLQARYEKYTQIFLKNVCNDPKLVKIKETRTGIKSIKFCWKAWGSKRTKMRYKTYE